MKILIVDDEKRWQLHHYSALKQFLINSDFTFANSAKEAYEILQNYENKYDYIFTDMQMEACTNYDYAGEWLIDNIKSLENCKKTKIIIISATENIQEIADKYDVDYIRKISTLSSAAIYQSVL